MPDKVTPEVRSRMMAAVRGKNTSPERVVRNALFSAGYRYRIHRVELPGSPDVVLPRFQIVVFVHGCFWHGHQCPRGRRPTSRTEFWNTKLDGNIARDRRNQATLRKAGWRVVVIWECTLKAGCRRLLGQLAAAPQSRKLVLSRELTR
jgi:DNA mismatch endonuclease, patch repair protein